MSVHLREEHEGKLILVTLSGKLTSADYNQFLPFVEEAIKRHGKINMMIHMHDFHGWTLGGLWQDVKFELKHFAHIDHLALIGQRKWESGMATFCKPFTTAKIKYFDESEAEEAEHWIRAATEPIEAGK